MSNIYTLKELVDHGGELPYTPSGQSAYDRLIGMSGLESLDYLTNYQTYWSVGGIGDDLFQGIWYRFQDCYCGAGKDIDEAGERYVLSFLSIWGRYHERYDKIIQLYKDNEKKLMDRMKGTTTSINRFNDTPQMGGDWSSDGYTTNITQGTVENIVDGATTMGRIEEIQSAYRNNMNDFIDKFTILFISPLNFDDEDEEVL